MIRLRPSGFTLSELLIVIAIIGIFSAMVLPNFMGVRTSAETLKNKRNAQMIAQKVTVLNAVSGSYAEMPVSEKIDLVCEGVVISSGTYEGVRLGVSGLTEEDIVGAKNHLSVVGGELIYEQN